MNNSAKVSVTPYLPIAFFSSANVWCACQEQPCTSGYSIRRIGHTHRSHLTCQGHHHQNSHEGKENLSFSESFMIEKNVTYTIYICISTCTWHLKVIRAFWGQFWGFSDVTPISGIQFWQTNLWNICCLSAVTPFFVVNIFRIPMCIKMECINLKRDHNMGMEFNAYKFFNTYNIMNISV